MLGTLDWLVIFVIGSAGLFIAVCILPHKLKVWHVRRVYRSLPEVVVDDVLELIEQAAANGPSVMFLRLSEQVAADVVLLESHVGGAPYAEGGDEWPPGTPHGAPAKFLLQVRLDDPALCEQWRDRLIVVYLVFGVEQAVRSYASPSIEKYVPLESKRPRRKCIRLRNLRMPAVSPENRIPVSPARLCEMAPQIGQALRPFTEDAVGVLSQILRPDRASYDLGIFDIAYVNGDPIFIEHWHEPQCDQCGQRMRFLFLFGEIIPGLRMANDGVVFVYGCDEHPDQCKGFLDLLYP